MGLVSVTLTFAQRHLCNILLNDMAKVDIETARAMRAIYKSFELREVRKDVEELTELFEKTKKPGVFVRWLDLINWEKDNNVEPRTFTTDSDRVKWLSEQISAKDWNKQVVRNPQTGEAREIETVIPLEQALVIADIMDAFHDAQEVKTSNKK